MTKNNKSQEMDTVANLKSWTTRDPSENAPLEDSKKLNKTRKESLSEWVEIKSPPFQRYYTLQRQ